MSDSLASAFIEVEQIHCSGLCPIFHRFHSQLTLVRPELEGFLGWYYLVGFAWQDDSVHIVVTQLSRHKWDSQCVEYEI